MRSSGRRSEAACLSRVYAGSRERLAHGLLSELVKYKTYLVESGENVGLCERCYFTCCIEKNQRMYCFYYCKLIADITSVEVLCSALSRRISVEMILSSRLSVSPCLRLCWGGRRGSCVVSQQSVGEGRVEEVSFIPPYFHDRSPLEIALWDAELGGSGTDNKSQEILTNFRDSEWGNRLFAT